MEESLRKQILRRHEALRNERAPWLKHWQDVSKLVLPASGRFISSERKPAEFNRIYDNTATRAMRTLAAGLMSGMTSPARPWFKLATPDPELMKYHPVKVWLDEVAKIIHAIFHGSNTYRALHTLYEELAVYGTAASVIEIDYHNIIHHHPLTAGEYCIATNFRGEVDTLYREFDKTVAEVVREFGYNNVSQAVRTMYDNGGLDNWITLIHAIEPRDVRNPGKTAKQMPWRSVYLEKSAPEGQILRESGYPRFPALCPRWSISGGHIYGTSPGMEALGDIKQLQHQQLRKATAIDYLTNPPLQVPTSMKNQDDAMLPGGIVYNDAGTPITPLWQVQLDLQHLAADMQEVRGRIQNAYYADLFLMISTQDTRMTATEVAERHEEKMLMIGPVLERLQNELLKPMIDITFDAVMQGGILPPPPPELQGMELSVQLVSILAQAQQAIATNSIDRYTNAVMNIAQAKPEVLDRLDADHWIDIYGDALGIDPLLIVPQDKADEIRQARAQQQAQAEQQAQMAQMADAAQKLGNTPTGGGSVLDNLTGYGNA